MFSESIDVMKYLSWLEKLIDIIIKLFTGGSSSTTTAAPETTTIADETTTVATEIV